MLPQVSSAQSPGPGGNAPAKPQDNEGGCILLAVDEPSIGRMLLRVFAKAGLRVFWVQGLDEALGWLKKNWRETAMAFIDCRQTEGECRGFCRCAREIRPGLPVLIAGAAEVQNVVDVLAAGGTTVFVPKPYLPTELAWLLRSKLGRPAA
jgi:DNA-binding response OmpR family regulator